MVTYYYPQFATGYYWIKGQWRFCASAQWPFDSGYLTGSAVTPINQTTANYMICPLNWYPSVSNFNASIPYTWVRVNPSQYPQPGGITVPKPTWSFPAVTPSWPILNYSGPTGYNSLYASSVATDMFFVRETTSKSSYQSMRTSGGKYQGNKKL